MNFPIEILFVSASIGGLTSFLASKRGRDPLAWFFIGMGFGIFGLVSLYFFKDLSLDEKPEVKNEPLPHYNWYYLDDTRQTIGPISTEEVIKLNDTTLVWNDTLTEWIKLEDALSGLGHNQG